MVKGRDVFGLIAVALLVTACASSKQTTEPATFPLATTPPVTTVAPTTAAATTAAPTTTSPPLKLVPTTLPAITLPPAAASSTLPVTTSTSTTAATKQQCLTSTTPPATAKNLQVVNGDVDGDGAPDSVWIYDMPDGPHLQIHTSHGATDAFPLGRGKAAAAVGLVNVDGAPGTANPGTGQEVMAAVSQADGTRLVGVFYYARATGCLENFQFASNAPFWYLVSRTGAVTGLHCTSDAFSSHLEAISADPTSKTTYHWRRIVFGRDVHRLVPLISADGTLTLPKDQATLAADGNVTGCILSRPLF
jgi:hypothetical protein